MAVKESQIERENEEKGEWEVEIDHVGSRPPCPVPRMWVPFVQSSKWNRTLVDEKQKQSEIRKRVEQDSLPDNGGFHDNEKLDV
ncbi:hypothetical protein EVAR_51934_1 [Eumeta japonica]|uniref:Uncharacterized protein n=1 Tax=Eumeta variegata TaxID=151549 RepID=A0A4C1YLX9_EUMVA|nr:hypothetical protein EVAR_51934_1 [Eumeta japonica]